MKEVKLVGVILIVTVAQGMIKFQTSQSFLYSGEMPWVKNGAVRINVGMKA